MKVFHILAAVFAAHMAVADAAYVDFDQKLIFPQELGGMACEMLEKYNIEDMGYTLFYALGEELSAEVSVLNMGRPDIADGYEADGVDMIFQSVEMQLERQEGQGLIDNVMKRGSQVLPKKSPLQFANRVFQYSELRVVDGISNSIPRLKSVYVTGSHNNFVKVEFMFDVAKGKEARGMADQLIKQMVLLLIAENTDDDLILAACDAAIYNPGDYSGKAAAQRVFAKAQTFGELNIYDALFVWPQNYSKPENADLLLSAYFAGMLKVVIPEKKESGGEFEAFVSMLKAYEAMRVREQIVAIPQLDEWAEAPDKKVLYEKLLVEFGYKAP